MTDQLGVVIARLRDQLGVPADKLWDALIKQAPITASHDVLVMILCVSALVFAFWFLKTQSMKWENNPPVFAAWVIWGFFVICLGVIASVVIPDAIAGFTNPEYWALTRLVP